MRVGWLLLLCISSSVTAAERVSEETLKLLERMATASQSTSYTGTFVFQQGGQAESSRIAHFVNQAGGVVERLEALDGPAREIVRTNDQVTCYLPGSRTVLIDPRGSRQFPVRIDQVHELAQYYKVERGAHDRVAGLDCEWVALTPKDSLRYARRFCAELKTGLPLKSRTIGEKNQVMESFAFTSLSINAGFRRELVQSRYAAISAKQGWRIDRTALTENDTGDSGWVVSHQPAGFRKMMELRRSMPGKKGVVSHLVFSDGLAAISVFIEPTTRKSGKAVRQHQGAVNIYAHEVAGHRVTVLGETPAETVMTLARSVAPKVMAAENRSH